MKFWRLTLQHPCEPMWDREQSWSRSPSPTPSAPPWWFPSGTPPSKTAGYDWSPERPQYIRLHKRLWLSLTGTALQRFITGSSFKDQSLFSSSLFCFHASAHLPVPSLPHQSVLLLHQSLQSGFYKNSGAQQCKVSPFQQHCSRRLALRIWWSSSWQRCDNQSQSQCSFDELDTALDIKCDKYLL